MKRRIRGFHVIVVSDGKDWSTKNNVLRVQSCCFAKKTFCRRRRFNHLSSLLYAAPVRAGLRMVLNPSQTDLAFPATRRGQVIKSVPLVIKLCSYIRLHKTNEFRQFVVQLFACGWLTLGEFGSVMTKGVWGITLGCVPFGESKNGFRVPFGTSESGLIW